ncbi:hypothetical protein [Shewanella putrefaciens]|uniref:hypothetical protein n=1 Tax=Shewanella putrefaciens TaxID=24 RepID=UPI001E3F41BA|nr:hypothetical protein [Shewanella putrefaciens]
MSSVVIDVTGEAPSRSLRLIREPVTSIRSTFAPSSSAAKVTGTLNVAAVTPLINAKRTDLANKLFLCIVYLPGYLLFIIFYFEQPLGTKCATKPRIGDTIKTHGKHKINKYNHRITIVMHFKISKSRKTQLNQYVE